MFVKLMRYIIQKKANANAHLMGLNLSKDVLFAQLDKVLIKKLVSATAKKIKAKLKQEVAFSVLLNQYIKKEHAYASSITIWALMENVESAIKNQTIYYVQIVQESIDQGNC